MSAVTNIVGGVSARAGVAYALWGRGGENVEHVRAGTTRAAAFACSMESPEEFIRYAEARARGHSRKYETYNLIQAWDPEVLSIDDPLDVQEALDRAVDLARGAFASEYLVAVHTDSVGKHVHAHIFVANHDELTGKALKQNTSWVHGLRQVHDELLRDAGYDPHQEPQQRPLEWEQRRNQFAAGGFEQVLGDKIVAALLEPDVIDRKSFERVLAEQHDVKIAVTDRDGISYKMRRDDNGKWGRRKASSLCAEFQHDSLEEIFELKRQQQREEEQDEYQGQAQTAVQPAAADRTAAERDLGTIVELEPQRRSVRAAAQGADLGGEHLGDSSAGAGVDLNAIAAELERARQARAAAARDRERRRRDEQVARRERARRALEQGTASELYGSEGRADSDRRAEEDLEFG